MRFGTGLSEAIALLVVQTPGWLRQMQDGLLYWALLEGTNPERAGAASCKTSSASSGKSLLTAARCSALTDTKRKQVDRIFFFFFGLYSYHPWPGDM